MSACANCGKNIFHEHAETQAMACLSKLTFKLEQYQEQLANYREVIKRAKLDA